MKALTELKIRELRFLAWHPFDKLVELLKLLKLIVEALDRELIGLLRWITQELHEIVAILFCCVDRNEGSHH